MRYTVVWHKLAQDELAELWLAATDREAIRRATDQIDRQLAESPEEKGTRVSERSRELTRPPLQVLFRVLSDDRIVQVFSVAALK
jgi:mRNA-degrading endonuclease RelE of RelBE toxin-antitoxin system